MAAITLLVGSLLIFYDACSKNLELDENGTAVSVDKRYVAPLISHVYSNRFVSVTHPSFSTDKFPVTRAKAEDDGDDDEEEEESSEEEEEEEEAPAATAGGQKEELTREQRRAQKKQAKAKPAEGEDGEEGDDPLEVNTNRGGAKTMKLSEVGALAPPSRREK